MLERLRHVVDEYETLERQLSDPEVLADSDELRRLSKRYSELAPVVEAYRRQATRRDDAEAARELLVGASGPERDMLVKYGHWFGAFAQHRMRVLNNR